ncbi:hypothetical protein DPMN_000506 [Dreissena polymorpha]|uniref:Uncharacterized protein n=1 Tax=Dreissena polymorpha TaxID=45954 RepID=A0A9D4RRU3_DREPO|nr:hypothetical protein DPMN_000506 [Dreissena polymorpha]
MGQVACRSTLVMDGPQMYASLAIQGGHTQTNDILLFRAMVPGSGELSSTIKTGGVLCLT